MNVKQHFKDVSIIFMENGYWIWREVPWYTHSFLRLCYGKYVVANWTTAMIIFTAKPFHLHKQPLWIPLISLKFQILKRYPLLCMLPQLVMEYCSYTWIFFLLLTFKLPFRNRMCIHSFFCFDVWGSMISYSRWMSLTLR